MTLATVLAALRWARGHWQLVLLGLALAWAVVAQLGWDSCSAAAASRAAALEAANRAALERAEALSNELVIEQARAMADNREKVVTYVDRIRLVPASPDDAACARSERMRLGNHGVRDLLGPRPEAGGGADGRRLPATAPGARP